MDSISPNGAKKPETPPKRGKVRRWLRALFWMTTSLLAVVTIALTALYFYVTRDIPTSDDIRAGCLASSDHEFQGRQQPLPLAQIPLLLQKTFVAMEDYDFYDRKQGRSLVELIRYSYVCASGQVLCCDSSIVRQVARQCQPANWDRNDQLIKLPILIKRLHAGLTNDELLEIYLNQVYLGRGAYGVEAAARTWFDKSASQLSPAETALLAASVRSPINPDKPGRARVRRLYVLERMRHLGFISEEQAKAAKEEEIIIRPVAQ